MIPFITLTGVDSGVKLPDLARLHEADAEIGFLYTYLSEGRPRYMDYWPMHHKMSLMKRAALHVCGVRARDQLVHNQIRYATQACQRIQVNGGLTVGEVERIAALYPNHIIITQHTCANEDLLGVRAVNHALLIDGSGGTGRSPDEWRVPETDKAVGFAGGLGPDNLARELERIQKVAQPGWWVDMENKIRTDDWFDVTKALECVKIFKENT